MNREKKPTLKNIKTGNFERQLSLASAGIIAGTRAASHLWLNALTKKDKRLERRKKMIAEQAKYLADELGKLKGSAVKIGQIMALYGEHVLPEEITHALRQLEEQTIAVDWPVMEAVVLEELGQEQRDQLEIDTEALAAASLGQVHRARRKSDGRELCLKIQYPGVADAIDSDLDAVARLLRWTRLISPETDFDAWLDEIRDMLHREVDYRLEATTTTDFRQRLADDPRFVVPEIFTAFSSSRVIAMSYESGTVVNSPAVARLPQHRRDELGCAFLELFAREVFEWSELQTDPNFGNYRIRPRSNESAIDQLVLLDFGAVKKFPDSFILPLKCIITGACQHHTETVINGAIALNMINPQHPDEVQTAFAQLCIAMIEPLNYHSESLPAGAVNQQQAYRWAHSKLPRRIAKQAAQAAYSKYFALPSGEFTLLSRKLLGVYSFIAALDAEFDGRHVMLPYLEDQAKPL